MILWYHLKIKLEVKYIMNDEKNYLFIDGYDTILKYSIIYIFGYYLSKKVFLNYKLVKDFKVKEDISVVLPPQLKFNKNEIDKEKIDKIKNVYLHKFYEVITKNFNSNQLNLMYNNLSNFKIFESNFLLLIVSSVKLTLVGGFYSPKMNCAVVPSNLLFLDEESTITAFYHELFHMASSYKDANNKIIYSGFSQIKKRKTIGIGLNEGYTQLMAERYFNECNIEQRMSPAYKICRDISICLEKIIGKDCMENLYLSANLNGLISELLKYDSKEKILEFITSCDFIIRYFKDNSNKKPFFQPYINSTLNFIYNCLINWYEKFKLIQNDLNGEEICQDVINFNNFLCKSLKLENNSLIYSDEQIQEKMEKIRNTKQM